MSEYNLFLILPLFIHEESFKIDEYISINEHERNNDRGQCEILYFRPNQVRFWALIIRAGNMGLARRAGPFSCKPEEGRACYYGGKNGSGPIRAGPLGPRAGGPARIYRPASFLRKKQKMND